MGFFYPPKCLPETELDQNRLNCSLHGVLTGGSSAHFPISFMVNVLHIFDIEFIVLIVLK